MSTKLIVLSFGLFLATATGCGSVLEETSSGGTSGGSTTTGGGGGAGGAGLSGESYSVKFGPVKVSSGAENTKCVTLRLGNPAPMHVGKIHNVLSDGSH